MSTETPRTDRMIRHRNEIAAGEVVAADWVRTLERELSAQEVQMNSVRYRAEKAERELAAAQQEIERLRAALREAARGFGLAYVTAAKHLHDETLLHCGHHEAAARRALGEEG